ncbi:MAG TPA: dienelactone hydrolase family protein [Gammaproteobacteria bacterium]|nr:dienelactone hydrolase family protein [Gammaproteobacteria bacterium]
MSDGESLDCLELGPKGPAEACVIWLHGLGADGHDFEPIVPELGLGDTVRFIFPHAPHRPVTINAGYVMRAWYDIASPRIDAGQDGAGIEASAVQVNALIARELERGMSPARVVLAGFSQGGAIALHVGLRRREPLAGVLALSTYLPLAERLANEAAPDRSVPIFMAHGTDDPIVPIALGRDSRDRLTHEGYAVQWHEYPMGHGVCPEEVGDIGNWLRQRLSAN